MRRILLVCLITCLVAPGFVEAQGSASTQAAWRYALPEAKALAGIELTRILNSPTGQQLRAKFGEAALPSVPGVELLDSVQSVFISSPGKPAGSTAEQPPVVIAVNGRFDLDQVRALAAQGTAQEGLYGEIPLIENLSPENPEMALALVSSQTLLLGDLPSVKAAIDQNRAAGPAVTEAPLFQRARALEAENDIWIVSEISPSDFTQASSEPPPFLNDVESIEFGLSLQSGLGAELNLGTASAESAQTLAGGLQLMLGMMLASQENSSAGASISKKLQVSTEEARVHLALRLDEAELASAFSDAASSLTFGGSGSDVEIRGTVQGSDSWSWEQEPKLPPEEQVIRIWGAEGGPIEIPMGE